MRAWPGQGGSVAHFRLVVAGVAADSPPDPEEIRLLDVIRRIAGVLVVRVVVVGAHEREQQVELCNLVVDSHGVHIAEHHLVPGDALVLLVAGRGPPSGSSATAHPPGVCCGALPSN